MPLDYSRLYAKFHPDTPEHRQGLTLLHQRMLGPHLPSDRSAPILDVGCGRGYALQDLAALGYTNLQGIDTDAGQIAFAQSAGVSALHVDQSEAFLAGNPESYDVILLMDVLEHLPRDIQNSFLNAILRSLRPGGRLICSVPNAGSAIGCFWLYNDYTHQMSFTDDSLGFLLEQAGFATVRCPVVEFFLRPRFLFWLPTRRTIAWWLRCCLRFRQRATYIAELGWSRGSKISLTPNILAVADKAE